MEKSGSSTGSVCAFGSDVACVVSETVVPDVVMLASGELRGAWGSGADARSSLCRTRGVRNRIKRAAGRRPWWRPSEGRRYSRALGGAGRTDSGRLVAKVRINMSSYMCPRQK